MDYRDTPPYRDIMREVERRSLAMSQPGPSADELEGEGVASRPARTERR